MYLIQSLSQWVACGEFLLTQWSVFPCFASMSFTSVPSALEMEATIAQEEEVVIAGDWEGDWS